MLYTENKFLQGNCDACGNEFVPDKDSGNVHYGKLTPHFGYGSELDWIGSQLPDEYHLCTECWKKACQALGIPYSDVDFINKNLWVSKKGEENHDEDSGRTMFWYPVWTCSRCGWDDWTKTYKIPDHKCEGGGNEKGDQVDKGANA